MAICLFFVVLLLQGFIDALVNIRHPPASNGLEQISHRFSPPWLPVQSSGGSFIKISLHQARSRRLNGDPHRNKPCR
jgi:hypothetical protein